MTTQNHVQASLARCVREAFFGTCLSAVTTALGDLGEGQATGLTEIEQAQLYEYAADWAAEMWAELEGASDAFADRNAHLLGAQAVHC